MAAAATIRTRNEPDDVEHGSADGYRKLFRSLFEQSGMCMASLDPGMRVLEANRHFAKQFGRGTADVLGREFPDFLHPGVRGRFRYQFARLVEGRGPRFIERTVAVGGKGAEPAANETVLGARNSALRPKDSGARPDPDAASAGADTVFAGELTGIAVPSRSGRAEAVLVLLRPDEPPRQAVTGGADKMLSELDARILEGVAAGESTVQLATKLYLSRGGVEYHVATLLRKLKVGNRPALVSKGYSLGILGLGQWPPRVLPEFVK